VSAPKKLDVGLAHQQIERELHDTCLHLREALGAAAFGVFTIQRGAKHVRIAFVRMHLVLMSLAHARQ
jgi:hypothetical protein